MISVTSERHHAYQSAPARRCAGAGLPRTRARHRFAVVLAVAAAFAAAVTLAGCDRPPERQSRTELLLGTTVTVTTYGNGGSDAIDAVFRRVEEIERKMSTSEGDYDRTELMDVNTVSGTEPVVVSADTFGVVQRALEFSASTGGAFDVTVYPLVKLWGIGTEGARIPSAEEIETATALVDYRRVRMNGDRRSIYLPETGMGIDVGGIAKGYAADEAARILREAGVRHALLDFGGNILTVGRKPDGSPWRIGIQVPDASRGNYLGVASVEDKAVVTSGTYERFFIEDGVRYHHILDTRAGYPVQNGLRSVTVITTDSISADALSTAVFALGLKEGRAFVEAREDTEALFITEDNGLYVTSGVDEVFELTNDEYELRSL